MRTSLEQLSVEAFDEDIVVRETAKRALESRKDFIAKFEACLPNLSDETVIALAHDGSREIRAIIARSERTSLSPFLGEFDELVLAEICLRLVRMEKEHEVELLQNLHHPTTSKLDPLWTTLLERVRSHPGQDIKDALRVADLVVHLHKSPFTRDFISPLGIETGELSNPKIKQALLRHGCLAQEHFEYLSEDEILEYAKRHYKKMVWLGIPLPKSSDFKDFLKEVVAKESDFELLDALLGFDPEIDDLVAHNPHTREASLTIRKLAVPEIERLVPEPVNYVRPKKSTTILKRPYPLVVADEV